MIPLHEPVFIGKEKKYLEECIQSGYVSTVGKFVSKFENKISKMLNIKYAVALNSCTSALHLSLKLVDVDREDEVIVPSITFIAAVNAIKYVGANPIFIDVNDYYTIDTIKLLEFIKLNTITIKKKNKTYTINKKTKKIIKAIIFVHCFGNVADLKLVKKQLKEKNIKIVEDAAESLGSYFNNFSKKIYSGTFGDVGCLSFNGNKIITSGGGGMLITNNLSISKKAFYLSTQAKDDAHKYIHNEIGYNYRMTNLQAAVGLAQLENLNKYIKKKKDINSLYKKLINNNKLNFYINDNPKDSFSINWLNLLRFNHKKISRDNIISQLKKNDIEARPVWYPNHLQKQFTKYQKYKTNRSLQLVKSAICLPSSYSLSIHQINEIVKIINDL